MKFCSQFYPAWARKKPVFRHLQNSGIERITNSNVSDFVSFSYAFFCPSSTRFFKYTIVFGIYRSQKKGFKVIVLCPHSSAFVGFSGRWKIGSGQSKNLEIEDLLFHTDPDRKRLSRAWALTKILQISCGTSWVPTV